MRGGSKLKKKKKKKIKVERRKKKGGRVGQEESSESSTPLHRGEREARREKIEKGKSDRETKAFSSIELKTLLNTPARACST